MSLVLTLAWRNLFQDRLRFVASLMGIVVSVVLVMVQMGLYLGFSGMMTTMIDHASTDLWIISTGAKYFEDLSLLNTRMRDAAHCGRRSVGSHSGGGRIFRLEPAGRSHDFGGRRRNRRRRRRTVALECRGRNGARA